MQRPLLFTLLLLLVYFANATLLQRQTDNPPEGADPNQGVNEGDGSGNGDPASEPPGIEQTCNRPGPQCPGYTNLIMLSDQTDVLRFCALNCKLDIYCAAFAYHSTTDGSNECRLYGQAV
ncbi:hypothetical protein BDV96DRAFT_669574 [Lophiotrema nucula]|uniref:Apple domain-containing protein n=1 Tax=Lophiotrema nucula TaxID=690887 RepID=A0A6A5YQJ3_9PLEO|nr:hypothetical protein BDV96DRAFT_669574 [Lophiotrema nucula]